MELFEQPGTARQVVQMGAPPTRVSPASCKARLPAQTDAIELDPLLSVIVLSTRIVYGKSSCNTPQPPSDLRLAIMSSKMRAKTQRSRTRLWASYYNPHLLMHQGSGELNILEKSCLQAVALVAPGMHDEELRNGTHTHPNSTTMSHIKRQGLFDRRAGNSLLSGPDMSFDAQ